MKRVRKTVHVFAITVTMLTIMSGFLVLSPRLFGYYPYIILSDSMSPEISAGSVAVIDRRDREVTTGEVVAYQAAPDVTVIHRVVDISEDGSFILKGDANDIPDAQAVSKKQIVGTYCFHIPGIGFFLQMMQYPYLSVGSMHFPGPILFLVAAILLLNVADGILSERERRQTPTDDKAAEADDKALKQRDNS